MKSMFANLSFKDSTILHTAPTLVLIATCVFAYGLCGPQIGWLSDDYEEVFGVSSSVPDWRTAFTIGGAGHWSIYRALKYPLQGYLGLWLGSGYAHVLQFMSHIICVLLFYALLKRIKWSTPASLAAALLFCSFPWISQAVYWWSAASTIWATVLILGAAHCLISWSESNLRRWLIAYASLVVLSLALYELWLGGFIFFAALIWYYQKIGKRDPKTANGGSFQRRRDSAWRYGKIGIPFLLYAVLYWTGPSSDASDRINLTLTRLPVSLAFVHLRAAQWPIDTQWRWTFLNASLAFHSIFGALCLSIEAVVLFMLCYAWIRRLPQTDLMHNHVPLWHSLVLGWSIFLGSRIGLILQRFISRYDTRENYAASMGVAVVAVALISTLIKSKHVHNLPRIIAGVMIVAIVFVLGWTSAGIGVHYVMTSQAEAQTIRTLNRWISASGNERNGLTIVVVAGANTISHGTVELSYFNEHDGYWLDYAIKRRCQDCNVVVTNEIECVDKRSTIVLHDPGSLTQTASKGRLILDERVTLFRWTGESLVRERMVCQ